MTAKTFPPSSAQERANPWELTHANACPGPHGFSTRDRIECSLRYRAISLERAIFLIDPLTTPCVAAVPGTCYAKAAHGATVKRQPTSRSRCGDQASSPIVFSRCIGTPRPREKPQPREQDFDDIPISWSFATSRFFIAFRPIFEIAAMPSWWWSSFGLVLGLNLAMLLVSLV